MNTFTLKKNFTLTDKTLLSKQKNKTEAAKKLLLTLSVFLLSFAVLSHPSLQKSAVTDSLSFCFKTLIPSLFPFMGAGELLILAGFPSLCEKGLGKAFEKIFGINGKGTAAFVIGAFCGFPVGGKAAISLYLSGDLKKEEAEKLIGICNNCGIGFLISGVGAGLWGSISFGVILYLCQLFSAVITGFFLFGIKKEKKTHYPSEKSYQRHSDFSEHTPSPSTLGSPQTDFSLSGAISSAVSSSVTAMLKVIGFVVFFEIILSLLGTFLTTYGASQILTSLVFAFTEITSGTKSLFSLSLLSSPALKALAKILTFTFSAFGGLSVYMQLCAIAIPEGVGTGAYIKTKLMQAFACTLLGAACVTIGMV